MLWTASLIHDGNVSEQDILDAIDQVIIDVQTTPIDQETFERAVVKIRSDLYDTMGGMFGFGRADLLASFALFDDNPERINTLEAEFRKVTPELLQKTAQEYLRPTNRTILVIEPKSGS
jgi:predicted Zn-dependent peptidase